VDISEGGLCLLSQVWLEPGRSVEIAIDVPGKGESRVRAEVWHVRRQRIGESSRRVWTLGLMLQEPDAAYRTLLAAAGVAAEGPAPQATEGGARGTGSADIAALDSLDPQPFRVRVKATGGPRTRLLTLTASSVEEAMALASRDLEASWTVVEVKRA